MDPGSGWRYSTFTDEGRRLHLHHFLSRLSAGGPASPRERRVVLVLLAVMIVGWGVWALVT